MRNGRQSVASDLPWGFIAVLAAGAAGAAFLVSAYEIEAGWAFLLVAVVLFSLALFVIGATFTLLPHGERYEFLSAVLKEVRSVSRKVLGRKM